MASKGATSKLLTKQSLLSRLTEGDLQVYVNWLGAMFFVALFVFFIFGEQLGLYRIAGIEWAAQQKGAFTDCSDPKNRNVSYCIPKETQTQREWSGLTKGGKALPFNLHDD